jgi:type III restriction enzyme
MLEAQIHVTNYHTFLLRDAKEIKGVAANTRKLLLAGKNTDPFRETRPTWSAGCCAASAAGLGRGGGVQRRGAPLLPVARRGGARSRCRAPDREDKARNENAGVWFKGLQAIDAKVGIKSVFDLSATPYYLSGSGYPEGYIFPWVVSDFSLMDSIESGIVKVPRMPVDDDASRRRPHLPQPVGAHRQVAAQEDPKGELPGDWVPPSVLEGALDSLYRSYRPTASKRGRAIWHSAGEPPPVMIVVCPNTTVSKLVFEWVAGLDLSADEAEPNIRPGQPAVAVQRGRRPVAGPTSQRADRLGGPRIGRHVQEGVQGRRRHRA